MYLGNPLLGQLNFARLANRKGINNSDDSEKFNLINICNSKNSKHFWD
jgi:hypothetical protein